MAHYDKETGEIILSEDDKEMLNPGIKGVADRIMRKIIWGDDKDLPPSWK